MDSHSPYLNRFDQRGLSELSQLYTDGRVGDELVLAKQLTKLAHAQPEMRKHIVPLLKQAGDELENELHIFRTAAATYPKVITHAKWASLTSFEKVALARKIAHAPVLRSVGLTKDAVRRGEAFMVYHIDSDDNKSKLYEGVIVPDNGMFRDIRRWGALTDNPESRADGKKFDMDDRFVFGSLDSAKRELGLSKHELLEKHYGLQPNFFERNFMLPAYLMRRFPMLKPVMDVVFRYHGMVNDYAVKIATPFMTKTQFLKRKVLDLEGTGLRYLFTHSDANDAASAIGLMMQEQRRLMTPDEITQIAANHGVRSPEAVQKIVDFFDAVKESSPRIRETIIEGLRTRIERQTAVMLADTLEGLGIEQAKTLGSQLAKGEWTIMTSQNAKDVSMAQATRMALLAQNPKAEKALRFAQPLLAQVLDFAKRTEGQPWFMSEMRLGKHMVAWWDKGAKKFGSAGFDSVEQLDAYVGKLKDREARGEVSSIRPWNKDDRQQAFSGLHPDFIKTLKELEGPAMVRAIVESGLTKEQGDKLMAVYEPLELRVSEPTVTPFKTMGVALPTVPEDVLAPLFQEYDATLRTLSMSESLASTLPVAVATSVSWL
jgi:hypothetical protein